MTLEEAKIAASIIQSFVLTAAALVGGIWALYRFYSMRSIEKAKADLKKVQNELLTRGIIEIDILFSTMVAESSYLIITVMAKNIGAGDEIINIMESEVTVSSVFTDEGGEVKPGTPQAASYLLPELELIGETISPSQTSKFPFIVPLAHDGVYLVNVQLSGSPKETVYHEKVFVDSGLNPGDQTMWGRQAYYEFKADSSETEGSPR